MTVSYINEIMKRRSIRTYKKLELSEDLEEVINEFSFANYHYIGHEGLLWNKSKALNYGIQKA